MSCSRWRAGLGSSWPSTPRGRRAATLEVGDHPVGRRLSDLDLAETGLFSDLWIDGEEWYTPPIHTHAMTRDPRPYLGRDSAQGTFAITRRGNVEKVDQAPTLPTRSPAPPVKASALS